MLTLLGLVLAIVGGVWIAIEAFKEGLLWGIGCLLIPLVGLIFVALHWDVAKRPFLIQMVGVALYFLGGGSA